MEGPGTTFSNEKYSVLSNFHYAEFLAYCTLEDKSNNTCEYQPDQLEVISLKIIMKSVFFTRKTKLMISGETMQCRKVI